MKDELTLSLVKDHDVILKAADRLEQRVAEWRHVGRIESAESLRIFITFSKMFTDRCHHSKEERCLFPCLEQRGIPREGGPIGVMLHEHELGRQLVIRLEKSVETYLAAGKGFEDVLSICEDYINLIRQHILKENHILFPMGERVASEEDWVETSGCYEEIELREMGEQEHHKLERLSGKI
ncbi:MAG: hemerythrin domain-containing protein [Nitrososphaerota archaeon]